ncbi:ninja-family protein 3-like [Gastrolobium bilobum]|uniref:ninja-family protein 3-like n=1 Tax=Gastrolobium bilobum TaxID=150636 RepID=UPI002AAFC079|nr:ninja-family protein 3-like [Gastrolobium bilobum]
MVEVEEIELDLGLSIGGSFRKPVEKPRPDSETNGFLSDSDPRERIMGMAMVGVEDPQSKRDIHALRRMEAKNKRQQKRVRESEPESECQRISKREKTDCQNVMSCNTTVSWTTPFHVQYVPLNNGFALPCLVPSDKNVGGIDGVINGGDKKAAKSNGSSRCSSSAVSDYQSSSREDGGSTECHSAHSLAEPNQLNGSKEINIRSHLEENASSNLMRSKLDNNVQERKHIVKETQPNIMQPKSMNLKEEAATNNKSLPMPINKPLSKENSSIFPLKDTKVDVGEHPKPLSQASSLPQMPYVSTKGNGPNGKTVNGFLFRYTKSEVSIVCVCHGSTFSPAEFVQHAGGRDISHPLRHITVIPSILE